MELSNPAKIGMATALFAKKGIDSVHAPVIFITG